MNTLSVEISSRIASGDENGWRFFVFLLFCHGDMVINLQMVWVNNQNNQCCPARFYAVSVFLQFVANQHAQRDVSIVSCHLRSLLVIIIITIIIQKFITHT